jgi:nucleoside-diphosphate-sugar epimerase
MTERITIFGYGPVGRATAARLLSEGREVIVAQRNAPRDLPTGATFAPVDALDREAVVKAVRGSGQFVVTIGFPYSGILWRDVWPRAMSNFVAACKATGGRMVFVDNLYMYGPQTTPLTETMSLSNYGLKPAARSAATRVWMAAAAAGEARVAALRAPDFYGPDVGLSFLGDTSIGKLAQGKPAVFVGSPGVLHDYAYVPTRTTRAILQIAADTLDAKLRISAMPAWMLGPSAMFAPFLRELKEMRFQWDRPYQVDASRFKAAFWSDVTPFETGVPETARAFRAELKRKR